MKHEAIVTGFDHKLEEYTRTAVCGRKFILVDKLLKWLRSPVEAQITRADHLLRAAYREWASPGRPITSYAFREGADCCLIVFCILQTIGCGSKVHFFKRKGKVDGQIPFTRETVQDIFRAASVEDEELPSKFYDVQYRFRPAKFDLREGSDWDAEIVIPIYQKNLIKRGGVGELWQINVPEEFVTPMLRSVASGSRFNASADSEEEPDWQYQFALKSFHSMAHSEYKNEMDAFRGLQAHDGMVRWLADYKKAHDPGGMVQNAAARGLKRDFNETSYNILLEYAQMDLSDYFKNMKPPISSLEIEVFWRALFAIADAVKGIHNLKVKDAGITEEYYGWHADIKPDNILFVVDRIIDSKPGDDKETPQPEIRERSFKLADPGFAMFVKKGETELDKIPKRKLWGGTETYGAPESPGRNNEPVSQSIDIWSLGCVFSLAATWITRDREGVNQFHKLREQAIRKGNQAWSSLNTLQDQSARASQGDFFHDGKQVLQNVTDWHKCLRGWLRKTDSITSQVLDLVDGEMLQGLPESRITASDLCSRLESILRSSSKVCESPLPDPIKAILEETDVQSINQLSTIRRSRAVGGPGSLSDDASIREYRQAIHESSLKFKQRRSLGLVLNSQMSADDHTRTEVLNSEVVAVTPTTTARPSPSSVKPANHDRVTSDSTIQTKSIYSDRRGTLKRHHPMNVFQAREAIERRNGIFSLSRLKFYRNKHEEVKDGLLLTSYFRGRRDIIFLVDNGESMQANWYQATFLLKTLVELAEGLDDDGMDLRFTSGNVKLEGKDSASKFMNSMDKARPIKGTRTDLRSSLGDILDFYRNKLSQKQMIPTLNIKDVVVIVLTDGIWAGMEDAEGVAKLLKSFQEELKRLGGSLKLRPFSVEFVQFGNDEAATQRLRYLDDHLEGDGISDIVDTEHSLGDVNKMLLGSFVEEYDNDEGNEMDSASSPSPVHQLGNPEMSPTSFHHESTFNVETMNQAVQNPVNGQRHHRVYSLPSSIVPR